jgi:aspartyl aminopeptidase
VFVRDVDGGNIRQELVKIDSAVLRIPNLAIHLQTTTEREAFKINKEDHLAPIIATAVKDSLGGNKNDKKSDDEEDDWRKRQEPLLVQLLASELDVDEKDIVDFELNLFDVQPATLGGVRSEFVHSARLDNLASCFLSLRGLINHVEAGGVGNDADISMIAMFDHEEVGSSSATGAGSPIVSEAVRRISHALGAGSDNPIVYDRAIQNSFVLSVDQAHAVHPNYASKHEQAHGPKMNGGMVIKRNSNQRYATNGITGLVVRELARRAGLPPVQEFVVRNDCGCGSTIGPIISTATGIRAIDMGCPQLSMHSIRETMGVRDFSHGLALFRAFFDDFSSVDGSIEE